MTTINISVGLESQFPGYEEGWQDKVTLKLLDQQTVIISCSHPDVKLYVGLEDLIHGINVIHQSFQPIKPEHKVVGLP